jgi:predicted Zn-dependent peptidase
VSASELVRAKDYLIGQTLLGLEDTAEHMFWLGESIIATNKVETFRHMIKKVEQVTLADVKRVAGDFFQGQRYNFALVGPVTEGQEGRLRKIFAI